MMTTSADTPLLSILMPVYNAKPFLKQAIDSILGQSYTHFELLIADDLSTDSSKAIIDSYTDPRIIRHHNTINKGKVATCNSLLNQAKGEYITIHDADDWSEVDRFEKQITFLLENPDYVMCGTSFHSIDHHGKLMASHVQQTDYQLIKERIHQKSQFHGPTILFRNFVPAEVGGLFRIMKMGEDIDFTMRVVEKYPASNLPDLLYYYRINPQSMTKSANHDLEEKYIDRHFIYFFANERRQGMPDSLTRGDEDKIEEQRQAAKVEFTLNRFKLTEEHVGYLLHYKLYGTSLKFVWKQMLKFGFKKDMMKLFLFVIKSKYHRA